MAVKLNTALTLHQQGDLDRAEAMYKEILQSQPRHFDALQLLATIAAQRGNSADAVALFDLALEINPKHVGSLVNRGVALQGLQRLDEALAGYDRALRINPDHAVALNNRASVLVDLKRPAEALESCDRVLRLQPDYADALNNRGNALRALARYGDALECYDRVLRFKPDHAEALNNRGLALQDLGRPAEALESHDRALGIRPDYVEALFGRGNALLDLKRSEEALESYEGALRIKPESAEALNRRGIALQALERNAEALESFDRALGIDADHAEALNNRGVVLRELKHPVDALGTFDRALGIRPDYADALYNRGLALQDLGRPRDALASYDRALRIRPDHPENHFNEGVCRLLLGDFASGWRKYESRWSMEPPIEHARDFGRSLWLGEEALEKKTILLHSEQGLGDTIQFCRYVPQVADLGATVVLEVQPALKTLLKDLPGAATLLAKGERLPEFDCHCPLLSLPLAFKAALENITGHAYLKSDRQRVERWQSRLGPRGHRRVGLVWSGNTRHKNDHNRSIRLEQFRTVLNDRTDYYCLQTEVSAADRAVLEQTPAIRFHGEEIGDFSDTAALVELMDLVITVDTSVAHLAGALGKAVWILLPFNPDWRWLLERSDSPWYRSARLFRQPVMGDWASVLSEVRALESLP